MLCTPPSSTKIKIAVLGFDLLIIALLLVAAVGILVWGYVQAKPYGMSGILSWLQTVVLMGPWLLFFGLSALGLYLNLAGILLLVVSSAGLYIYLGRRLRATAQANVKAGSALGVGPSESVKAPADTPQALAAVSSKSTSVSADAEAKDLSESGSPLSEPPSAGEPKNGKPDEPENLPPIPAEDMAVIESIFGIDTFFRTKSVPYQEGVIFKGNLRGKPDETAQMLSDKLAEKFGDKYRSFLLMDPDEKPTVVVLPSSNGPNPASIGQRILAVALAIATLATCLETAGILQSFDLSQSPERWPEALPIMLGLVAILGTHEFGHRIMAKARAVKLSWPVFLPALQLGAFGSITRFESILPNRSVLFDVSFAGPAAGGIFSFVLLFLGLVLSHPGSQFQLPGAFFQGSILVGTLARTVLGDALKADLVDVHPLLVIGWMGLIITAINIMPAGRLDGGRMVQAIYGRKTLVKATTVTLVLLALVGLFNPLALYWAVLVVFLQRQPERPCMDDLTEPDDTRAALALVALLLMLLVLLPLTPSLAGRLGIG